MSRETGRLPAERMDRNTHHSKDSWTPYAKVYDPLKIGSIDCTDTEPHDNGIWRALNSTYVPNKNVKGIPRRTIFVSRLNPRTTEDTITEEFSKYGNIVYCRLVRDIVTGKSKRYAFVEYDSSNSAYKAYKSMHKEFIDNSEILVDYEMERSMAGWIPRRMGGGFGGKKESGQLRFGCRDRPFLKPIVIGTKRSRDEDDRSNRSEFNYDSTQSKRRTK